MVEEPEIREDFSEIEAAHAAAEQRVKEVHDAAIEERLAPARSQARLDESQAEAAVLKAQGDKRLRTGGAVMAGLVGTAAVIWAAAQWHKVEVVHDTKIVTETKTVEVPKIVETVKVVEVPKLVEHTRVERVEVPTPPQQRLPQPEAAKLSPPIDLSPPPQAPMNNLVPQPGEQMTQNDFKNTPMFRTAQKCAGKLVSHINGVLSFADGSRCFDANADGTVDPSTTTARHNGDQVVCNDTGRMYPSGKPEKNCLAWHNGTVEDVRAVTRSQRADDPFADLFNP